MKVYISANIHRKSAKLLYLYSFFLLDSDIFHWAQEQEERNLLVITLIMEKELGRLREV